jgi:hypothetical protein
MAAVSFENTFRDVRECRERLNHKGLAGLKRDERYCAIALLKMCRLLAMEWPERMTQQWETR